LFVGPSPWDQEDFEHLRSEGITAILSLQTVEDVGERGIESEETAAKSANLRFHNVPVADFDLFDLARQLPACVTELKRLLNDGQTVYLHCTAGVNRSPTVAVAYLYWCLGWPLEQAVTRVRKTRECCPLPEVICRAQWYR
jgi:protein-tyrosine phosphatase